MEQVENFSKFSKFVWYAPILGVIIKLSDAGHGELKAPLTPSCNEPRLFDQNINNKIKKI